MVNKNKLRQEHPQLIIYLLLLISFISLIRTVFLLWNSYLPDFSVFYASARLLLLNRNPYIDPTLYTAINYPPVTLFLLMPFSFIPFVLASKLWLILSLVCLGISLLVLKHITKASWLLFTIIFLIVCVSFPLKFTVGMGQINLILMSLIVGMLYGLFKKNDYISGIFLALAIIIKLFPVLLLIPLLIHKKWRVAIITVIVTLGIMLVSFIVINPSMYEFYFKNTLLPLIQNPAGSIYYNQSLTGVGARLNLPILLTNTIRVILFALTVFSITKSKSVFLSISVMVSFILLSNSFTWQHHHVLLVIPFFLLLQQKRNININVFLLLAALLVSINIKNPHNYDQVYASSIILSHGFFGTFIVWLLQLNKSATKIIVNQLKKFSVKTYLPFFGVFIFFLFGALYITYPLIFHINEYIAETQDALLISWILRWDQYAFSHNLLNIFNAPIYYPYQNTLAYSDTHFTAAVLALFASPFLREPIALYNFNLLLSFTLLGFCTYLLCNKITKHSSSSLISGLLAAFSTYVVSKYMHLQLIEIFFIPLCLLFFIQFVETKKTKYLFFSVLMFVLQTYNSFLPGFFLLFIFCNYFALQYRTFLQKFRDYLSLKNSIILAAAIIVILPITLPYFSVSKEFRYVRDIRDTIQFANRPEYTFYPSDKTRLNSFIKNLLYKNDKGPFYYDGYIGLAFFVLAFFSILYVLQNRKKFQNSTAYLFLTIGVGAWILSLGPAWQWGGHVIKKPFVIPLPYAVFYYLVPGFKGFRNSARWEMLFVFAISMFIGIVLAQFLRTKNKYWSIILTLMATIAVLGEFTYPFHYFTIPHQQSFPPVYSYLNSLKKVQAVIHIPWYNWDVLPYSHDEQLRMYYSTVNFVPMVNGGSGFSPPPWQSDAKNFAAQFPNQATIQWLQKNRVSLLVLHKKDYDMLAQKNVSMSGKKVPSGDEMIQMLAKYPSITIMKILGDDIVYQIK